MNHEIDTMKTIQSGSVALSGSSQVDALQSIDVTALVAENQRRNEALRPSPYNQLTGEGCCGERVRRGDLWLPRQLIDDNPCYCTLPDVQQRRLRIRYDFEYWCATCASIRDKLTGGVVRFLLNEPQRRLVALIEAQRAAGRPVRVVLLKARQWGGSTLVQMYMAWMQLVRHTGWNSLICGHLRQSARAIKGMYSLLLSRYPDEMLDDDAEPIRFKNYEGSSDVQVLSGRDSLVIMGTAVSEDAVRGYNLAMAHLTEVAFWPETPRHSPQDVMRSVNGTVTRMADSVVVLESTANGVGNFFHTEWLRAQAGESDKVAVFVPWYEIEIYRSPVTDAAALWASLDDYERALWADGRTLEMIQWYHDKRREAASHAAMMAEFPTTATEAFVCSGHSVFDAAQLERLREHCRVPLVTGDVVAPHKSLLGVHFVPSATGLMSVWRHPEAGAKYVVSVDIGGRSERADYSVIAVLDVSDVMHRRPEVVAQWRGHIDHDLLAWKAAQVATMYNRALLVVECNSLLNDRSEGTTGGYLLDELARHYRNVYRRESNRVGFLTERQKKPAIIANLIAAVRDAAYVERDHEAVNEMMTYEQHGAVYEAQAGHHDDIVMTRAIALWVVRPAKATASIAAADKAALYC